MPIIQAIDSILVNTIFSIFKIALRDVAEGQQQNGTWLEAFGLLATALTQIWEAETEKRAALQDAMDRYERALQRIEDSDSTSSHCSDNRDEANASNGVTTEKFDAVEITANLIMAGNNDIDDQDRSRQEKSLG